MGLPRARGSDQEEVRLLDPLILEIGIGHDRVVGCPGIDDPIGVISHAEGKTPLGDLVTKDELIGMGEVLGEGTKASRSSFDGDTGGVAGSGMGGVVVWATAWTVQGMPTRNVSTYAAENYTLDT